MKYRQKVQTIVCFVALHWIVLGCSKSGSDPEPLPEENLVISTNASPLNISVGPDFTVALSVDSKMPADGVRIEYDVKGESDGQVYPQGPAIETKATKTNIILQSLPRQKVCIGTIRVISKTKSTNRATVDLRVVYK